MAGAGWKFPESFTAKADDGVTDIYGVMYKPFDFDPAKKYPIVAYVYPGPQTEGVMKSFGANATVRSFLSLLTSMLGAISGYECSI